MPRMAARTSLVLLACIMVSAILARRPVLANVDLIYFRATSAPDIITLEWETATELDNLGFNILRSESSNVSEAQAINLLMIPSQVGGQPTGAYYEWEDEDVDTNTNYYYWLQDVDFNGDVKNHGPVEAALAGGSLIPTAPPGDSVQPTSTPTETLQAASSPTIAPTVRSEVTQSGSPQIAPSSTPIPTTVLSLPTSSPAALGQPELSPQPTNLGTAAGEPNEASSPPTVESQNGIGSSQSIEESVSTPTPLGSDSSDAALIADAAQQPPPNAEITKQFSTEINAQIIGDTSERQSDSEEVETENGGIFESSTFLALIVLVVAFLLAIVAGITIWLVFSSKRVDPGNE